MLRWLWRCALPLLLCVAPARPADLPVWPHEQQRMLLDVEDRLLQVQHQLFKARQLHDEAATEQYGKEFRELQETRTKLILITKDQLPSE